MEMSLQDTLGLIKRLHEGQVDKSGVAFYLHPIRVMGYLPPDSPEAWKQAALLHDVVEDTEWTLQNLRNLGYSEEIVTAVMHLTRFEGETYFNYIKDLKASGNKAAIAVKIADLMDNSDPERMKALPDGGKSLSKKYKKAMAIMLGV